MTFGLSAGAIALIGAGATVAGGAIAANGAKKAGQMQAGSAADATEAERQAMERQIALQAPWREAGGLGLNALTYGLGLSPTGTFRPGVGGQEGGVPGGLETSDQIRERLTPQFVTSMRSANPLPTPDGGWGAVGPQEGPMTTERRIDEAALSTAVRAEVAKQQKAEAARLKTATATAGRDPNYGNLLRDFSMQDFQRDPGYAFRQAEGEKALDRASAAGGRFGSGRAGKDFMRFNQGLATEEYGNAFSRFRNQQDVKFNRLASISGIGQTATEQATNSLARFGAASANNIIGAGNVMAAGRVGANNALTGAIGQGLSSYQQASMMNRPQSGWSNPNGWNGTSLGNHFLGNGTGGD